VRAPSIVLPGSILVSPGLARPVSITLSEPAPGLCAPPPAGMVAWWRGNGDAGDAAGGHAGTTLNGAPFAAGFVGQAFSFDGVDDVVSVPDASDLGFGPSSPMSTDGWIFRTGSAPVLHLWGKRPGCAGGINYQMAIDESIGCGLGFGGDSGGACTATAIPLNVWTHVAATFDGATFRLYVNGAQVATSPGSLGPATTLLVIP